jgi:CDGSH-type Zn-finger protein
MRHLAVLAVQPRHAPFATRHSMVCWRRTRPPYGGRLLRGSKMADSFKITVRPNGPYLLEGDVQIVDIEGRPYDKGERPRIALCRCGGSTSKPFCDGTHTKIGFAAAEAAVQAETERGES